MANSYFQFKNFTIYHDLCAMKVGTDGVLLGAWAAVTDAKKVLDIGTGTGLIALMLAQRNQQAFIDAIDIDAGAAQQAVVNVLASPYASQIEVKHMPLDRYAEMCSSRYDLIVSNPPYFEQSLKCPNGQRSLARHTDSLSLDDLFTAAAKLLTSTGRIALVLPADQFKQIETVAARSNLFVSKCNWVHPTPTSIPKRILIELSQKEDAKEYVEEHLVIELARHKYTPEYIALTKHFYLKM